MKKLLIATASILLASSVFSGCRTLKTEVVRGPGEITLPSSYAWTSKVTGIVGESRSDPQLMDKLVKGLVDHRMDVKEIPRTDERFADLIFDYTANLSIAREEMPDGFAHENHPATMVTLKSGGSLQRSTEQEVEVRFYETGTLIVTVVDRKSGQRVWTGTTVIEIDQDDSQNRNATSLRHALNSLLKKFP